MILNRKDRLWKLYEKCNLKSNIYNGEVFFSEEEKEVIELNQKKVLIENKLLIFLGMMILIIIAQIDKKLWLYQLGYRVDISRNTVVGIIVVAAIISCIQEIKNRKKILEIIAKMKKSKNIFDVSYLKYFKILIISLYLIGGVYLWAGGIRANSGYWLGYEYENFEWWFIVANTLVIIYLIAYNIYYFMIKKFITAAAINLSKAIKRGAIEEVKESVKFEGNAMNLFGDNYSIFFKELEVLIDKVEKIELDKNNALRHRTEVITNASHDIKTPLTSIKNYIYILENNKLTRKEKEEYIDILKVKIKNLSKLIDNLKIITEGTSNSVVENLMIEKIKIVELIEEIFEEYKSELLEKRIEINRVLDKNIENIKVGCDEELNKTIFRNLFSNIQKYALEDTKVDLEIKKENSCLIIEMKNISKEKIMLTSEEIMERFKRGDESRHIEGHGLGLDIVKKFVQLQNGVFSININEEKFESKIKYLI